MAVIRHVVVGVSLAVFVANLLFADGSGLRIRKFSHPPSIKLAEPPSLDDPDSFSIILFGDPQSYVKYDFNQPLFEYMTAWTAAQKENLKVKTVLCTGDMVEQNDNLVSGGQRYKGWACGNQPSSLQWAAISRAFERLDGVYPYIVCTGNHDYGYDASENRLTRFPEFFDVSRNHRLWGRHLVSTFPNSVGKASLENAAFEFFDKNWGKILIIALEFSPRDETLEWAKKLCSSKNFMGHKVIILTHSLLTDKGNYTKDGYKVTYNGGEGIYKKLLSQCPNIKLAICGHTGGPSCMESRKVDKNAEGGKIEMMMFNPQAISGWDGNGGDGWLRILEFKPDGKTISVKTYSPIFAFSKKTEQFAWDRSPKHQFDLVLE